jgi:hypothetical protein
MGPYCNGSLFADRTKVLSASSFLSLSALDLIHLFMCKCVLVPNAVKNKKEKFMENLTPLVLRVAINFD